MKIAFFCDAYVPTKNGVAISARTTAEELRVRGHRVVIFAPRYTGYGDDDPDVVRFAAGHWFKARDYPVSYPFLSRIAPRTAMRFRREKFDVVHVHSPFVLGGLGGHWAQFHFLPLVWTFHTLYHHYAHYSITPPRASRWYIMWRVRTMLRKCDRVIAPSHAIERIIEKLQPGTPTRVLPTGVDVVRFAGGSGCAVREKYGIAPDETVLLYVGRVAPEKNLEFLLRSLAPLLKKEKARLLLVGGGPALENCRVLFTDRVLLPGDMLRGFAPFGSDLSAPWTILQWDALAQYYPWRLFAARELHGGHIPLWNPHQFSGAPFLANAQSAVFYPLNFPFWLLDTARAFAVTAFLHSLLASFGTYFLARSWNQSRPAAALSAIAFAFCGYLASWALLPTLFATACWLPLCLLLLEKAAETPGQKRWTIFLGISLACALLAGHAQIFFYVLVALFLRALFYGRHGRVWPKLGIGFLLCALLTAPQLLPTLELAKLGHRAAGAPTAADWQFWLPRALQGSDLPSLFIPAWPLSQGTLGENFGYLGTGVLLLSLCGIAALVGAVMKREGDKAGRREEEEGVKAVHTTNPTLPPSRLPSFPPSRLFFSAALAAFGLLYAMATPLAQLIFFRVPGVSQMGGTGRALLLWSLGMALLAGFGLDWVRTKIKTPVVPLIFGLWICAELCGNAWTTQPTAPRSAIYPSTALTTWLRDATTGGERILFLTPPDNWLPAEAFNPSGFQRHPRGVLPPNGAMVYGLLDANGYDSLSPRTYRAFLQAGQREGISPPLNGNMVLLSGDNQKLDALNVRFLVATEDAEAPANTEEVWRGEGCVVYERTLKSAKQVTGANFYPGWKNGNYDPQVFRLGLFLMLCTLSGLAACAYASRKQG